MKKFISLILVLFINVMMISPVLAEENIYQEENAPVLSTTIEEENIFLDPKSKYVLELE